MPKFKPQFILDEQMYLADTQSALLFQIREELRDLNSNIKNLVASKEETKTK